MNDGETYVFTMIAGEVEVEVEFHKESEDPRPKHNVTLHLLNASGADIDVSSYDPAVQAELVQNLVKWTTKQTDVLNKQMVIEVPYMEQVEVNAQATSLDALWYIKETYVMLL